MNRQHPLTKYENEIPQTITYQYVMGVGGNTHNTFQPEGPGAFGGFIGNETNINTRTR